jgi:flagellar hook protein FlgE
LASLAPTTSSEGIDFMLRSLYSGISGLRAHQQMMDVTGNNIANVNTTGYKSSQTQFEDTLSQTLRASGAPTAGTGGVNPAQVGLGVRLAGITTNFTQGSAQTTGRSTDLMITGDGFFAVKAGGEPLYTRNGSFNFDANGLLVTGEGATVQGWTALPDGTIPTNGTAGDISLPIGTLLQPVKSTTAQISGNLPADTTSTAPLTPSITVYDEQGNAKQLTVSFTKVDSTHWDATVTDGTTSSGPTSIAFNTDGTTPVPTSIGPGAPFPDITIDVSGLSSYAGKASVAALEQNGSSAGSLQGFTVSSDGTVIGSFSNGLRKSLAQIGMATFNNPTGLERAGNSTFRTTPNSGTAQLGVANSGGRGSLQGGTLEMSNVDLAQEFTNLIIAQRGFQANSKVISTSDELLNDLVNLKR